MKVLITGAGGNVGRGLARELAARGDQVVGLAHSQLDTTDAAAVNRWMAETAPDLVVHCAAMTNVDLCAEYPDEALRLNASGTQTIALACQRYQTALCYLSTNEVFDGERSVPYQEYDLPKPANAYGYSKWIGEQIATRLVAQHYIVRLSWLFGHGGHNFLQKILRMAETGSILSVVTDETACPTYADDFIVALGQLLHTQRYGVYHLVNEGQASRYEFARRILDCYGYTDYPILAIGKADYPRPSRPPTYSALRNFFGAELGIRLRPWHEAVAAFVEREQQPIQD